MVYDLLYDDGRSLTDEPYTARREALDALGLTGSRWQTAPSWPGDPQPVLRTARDQHLPGILGKRLSSRYEPGASRSWLYIPT